MGDLHSITYFSNHPNNHESSMCWDFHNFQLLNTHDISHCMETNITPQFYDQSMLDSDLSSGYLEDALFEFRSKRRRLTRTYDDLFQPNNQNSTPSSIPSYWDFNATHDQIENFGGLNVSGDDNSTSSSQSKSSSINNNNFFEKENINSSDQVTSCGIDERKKKVITRVVYPFALVKPGGFKGDMTLNDINERILMPPTRPVRHPVGDFACRRLVSLDGPGLSGKAVVALTRIQTHGRGTITIIRTKN
uniref:protein XRI1-like n=1 Tax=Erigeron canadensis TaxID=72917 RepID=UPI001CB895DF|nr:protein XRI1-like [Erigeron canadensis]